MNETLVFDYYYGKEAEQFSFYRIPRMLIKDKHFSSLSNDAKILYGLMLDRMSLSLKNEWQDDQDRTYIIYTIDNIMEDLNCGKNKAVRIMAELDSSDGIGLIERVRRGLGKPDIIYVKNFVGVQIIEKPNYEDEDAAKEEEKAPSNPHKSTEVSKANFKKFQKQTSASLESKPQEVSNANFSNSQIETSVGLENKLQEVSNEDSNYTYNSYTDNSHTDNNQTDQSYTEGSYHHPIHLSGSEDDEATGALKEYAQPDVMDEIDEVRQYMKSIIEYNALIQQYPTDRSSIDELLELMVEVIVSPAKTIRISGVDMPKAVVCSRFEKYDMFIFQYVLQTLKNNTTKVRNIRAYLLTTLYNAPVTMSNYYQSEVNHDLYGTD